MTIRKPCARLWHFLWLIALSFLTSTQVAFAMPLLMEGKTTLYKRVLTRPGAEMHVEVEGRLADEQPNAFSIFYVFDQGEGWMAVGPDFAGEATGWIREEQLVEWKQTIVVAFTNPADRERSLLFSDHPTIEAILNSEDYVAQLAALREQAISGTLPADTLVRSIEPEKHVHTEIEESFYLLPILDHTKILNPLTYEDLQILKVAAISANPTEESVAPPAAADEFRAGVVFVVDTTKSMRPYIELTRNAIHRIMTELQEDSSGVKMDFGLVGFRDSTIDVPELEYVSKTFVPLAQDQDPDEILAKLDEVKEATASSVGFNEDVYAGFSTILDEELWKAYQARYAVLITDAGPKLSRYSTLGDRANSAALGRHAEEELKITTYVMHLRTSGDDGLNERAEAEYSALANAVRTDGGSRYYPIADGTAEAFAPAVDGFVEGVRHSISLDTAQIEERLAQTEPGMLRDIYADTLAKRLAYLGARDGERVPSVFDAWIAQRVLENTRKNALDVRLLISKDQLNTLTEVLQNIIESAGLEQGRDSSQFFDQLRSALAAMSRDPTLVVNTQFETLGETLGEFLEDLPYASALLQMSEERWVNLSPTEQFEFLGTLKTKLGELVRIHNTPSLWTSLHPSSPPGEHVYPVLLDYMP